MLKSIKKFTAATVIFASLGMGGTAFARYYDRCGGRPQHWAETRCDEEEVIQNQRVIIQHLQNIEEQLVWQNEVIEYILEGIGYAYSANVTITINSGDIIPDITSGDKVIQVVVK